MEALRLSARCRSSIARRFGLESRDDTRHDKDADG
jgi:hypothetical protein